MPQVGRRSREIIDGQFPQIVWEHSHVTVDDEGTVRTFCIYSAPDEAVLHEHANRARRPPVGEISEIAGRCEPGRFPAGRLSGAVAAESEQPGVLHVVVRLVGKRQPAP